MPEINDLVGITHAVNPLREPLLRSAVQVLGFPQGSWGLDAGCGIGLQTLLLAEAVGPNGHVTGLDLSPEVLVRAADIAEEAGLFGRISFQGGDINELPFGDDSFDWAWSVDCVGYAPFDPLPPLKELARVVRPGGVVVILAWSSERLLPGYPLLEARLNATTSGIAPFVKGKNPELHFSRALGWFRQAGLQEPKAKTFTGDVYASLTAELRTALITLFQMRWSEVKSELAPQDCALYRRLCQPESPEFIANHPDYYAFFTYSMFYGKVPG